MLYRNIRRHLREQAELDARIRVRRQQQQEQPLIPAPAPAAPVPPPENEVPLIEVQLDNPVPEEENVTVGCWGGQCVKCKHRPRSNNP